MKLDRPCSLGIVTWIVVRLRHPRIAQVWQNSPITVRVPYINNRQRSPAPGINEPDQMLQRPFDMRNFHARRRVRTCLEHIEDDQRRRLRIHPLFQRTQPVCLVHLSTLGNPNASTAMAIHFGLWGYDFQSASQNFFPRTSFSNAEPDTYIDDLSG